MGTVSFLHLRPALRVIPQPPPPQGCHLAHPSRSHWLTAAVGFAQVSHTSVASPTADLSFPSSAVRQSSHPPRSIGEELTSAAKLEASNSQLLPVGKQMEIPTDLPLPAGSVARDSLARDPVARDPVAQNPVAWDLVARDAVARGPAARDAVTRGLPKSAALLLPTDPPPPGSVYEELTYPHAPTVRRRALTSPPP